MVLYEDIEYDQKTKNVVTKIVSSLRKTLKDYSWAEFTTGDYTFIKEAHKG